MGGLGGSMQPVCDFTFLCLGDDVELLSHNYAYKTLLESALSQRLLLECLSSDRPLSSSCMWWSLRERFNHLSPPHSLASKIEESHSGPIPQLLASRVLRGTSHRLLYI